MEGPKFIPAFFTHVPTGENNPHRMLSLWAQLDKKTVEIVEQNLLKFTPEYNKGKHKVDLKKFDADAIYCAKFNDSSWYRCTVKDLSYAPAGAVKVFFVDFGNSETVFVDDLRLIQESISKIEPQAQELILRNVLSIGDKWSKEAIQFIKETLVYEEDVTIRKMGSMQGIPVVRIYRDPLHPTRDFAKELVAKGYGCLPFSTPSPSPSEEGVDHDAPSKPLKLGSKYDFHVVHVESPLRFWVQTNRCRSALGWGKLNSMLEVHFQNTPAPPCLEGVEVGQHCLARNEEKGCYARGIIAAVEGRSVCSVRFVDYGNVETKTLDEVFASHPNFTADGGIAKCCALDGAKSSAEDERFIFSLRSGADAPPVTCRVLAQLDDGRYGVELLNSRTPQSGRSPAPEFGLSYTKERVGLNVPYGVEVTYVKSAVELYVTLLERKKAYNLMHANLQLRGQRAILIPVERFQIGLPCMIKVNGQWLRGKVTSPEVSNMVKVVCMDTGYGEMTTEVYGIPPDLVKMMPAQAIRCSLANLDRKEGNEPAVITELKNYASVVLQMEALEYREEYDTYDITLTCLNKEKPVPVNILLKQMCIHMPKAVIPPASVDGVEKLFVTAFDSVHSFFGQLEKVPMEALDELQGALTDHYGAMMSSDWLLNLDGDDHVGDFCCALYSLDKNYYRGRILSYDSNTARVLFVDYGNQEDVKVYNIKYLKPEFATLPQMGITCAMANTLQLTVDSPTLGKAILNKVVTLEIVGPADNHVHPIAFCESKTNPDLNKKLVSYGALVPKLQPILEYGFPDLANEGIAFISNFTSPIQFWVQFERNRCLLDEVTAQVEEYVTMIDPKRRELLTDFRKDVPCLAKFSLDDSWYRSRVKRFVKSEDSAEVHFVDWGNVDKVPRQHLLPIPKHLMAIPLLAVECSFANVRLVEFTFETLRRLEQRLLDKSFEVNVLTHQCPVKLEFKNERDKAILVENNVLKTAAKPTPEVPTVNGNGNFKEEEDWQSQTINTPLHKRPSPTPLMNIDPMRHFNEEMNGDISEEWDDSGGGGGGRPHRKENPDRSPHQNQNGWSGSQHGSDDGRWGGRKGTSGGGFRDAAPRFVPPRMQRQMGQEEARWGRNDTADGSFDGHTSSNRDPPFGGEPQAPRATLTQQPDLCGQIKFVTVTHVLDPGELYCQLTERREELSALLSKLQTRYGNESGLPPPRVEAGAVCCARFSQDRAWYRAKVVRTVGGDAVVSFVDYGNEETVPASQLRELVPEFLELPAQAVKCRLEGVGPTGTSWTAELRRYLEANVQNKNLLCQFVEKVGEAFEVRLLSNTIQDSYETVTYDLMAHGLALPKNLGDWKYKEILGSRATNPFPEPEVELGAGERATVTWVNNPGQFFCQLETRAGQLKDLEDRLKSGYAPGRTNEALGDVTEGGACVALFCNEWYRAVVLATDGKEAVVFLADYGNVETVKVRDLKKIVPELMKLPVSAYKCNLRGVGPIGKYWPKMDGRKFQKYFDGTLAITFRRVCSRGFEVDAMLSGKNIAKQMIADKLAFAEPLSHGEAIPDDDDVLTSSLAALVDAPVFVPAGFQNADAAVYGTETPVWKRFAARFDERVEVMFAYTGPPSQFFLQNADDETTINTLLDDMGAEYADSTPADVDGAPVGSLVAAQFSEDEAWYRAVVLEEAEDERLRVKFVDFGNEELVSRDAVCSMTARFESLPQLAAECELHDILTALDGADMEAVLEAFNELIENGEKRLTAVFKGRTGEKFHVQLLDGEKDVGLELLEKLGLPPPAPKPAAIVVVGPSVGDSMQVYVAHIDALAKFYVQKVSDEDRIGELQETLNAHCADKEADAEAAVEGATCLARYSDDNWYRAVVLDVGEEGVKVHFSDYGNSDVVARDRLQKIPEDLAALPRLALKCALRGSEGCGETQEMVDSFYEKTGQGAAVLTAEVVARVGDSCVVRLLDGDSDVGEALFGVVETGVTATKATMAPQSPAAAAAFKEPEIALGEKLEAYLTSITSPSLFYVQLNSRSTELFEMAARLDEAFADSMPEENLRLEAGAACVALYSGENWCRATVLKVEDELITVFFVDYGNTESVKADCVRGPTPEFCEMPTFACRCRLSGLNPPPEEGDWPEELNEEFRQLLNYGESMCLAVFLGREEDGYVVRLLNMGLDVAESLVVTGLAEPGGSPVEGEATDKTNASTASPRRQSPEDKIVPGCISNVVLAEEEEALDAIDEGACDLDVDITDNPDETFGASSGNEDGAEVSDEPLEAVADDGGIRAAEREDEERPDEEQSRLLESRDASKDCTEGGDEKTTGAGWTGGSAAMDIIGSTTDEEVGASTESIEYVEMEDAFEKIAAAGDRSAAEAEELDRDIPEGEDPVLLSTESGDETLASCREMVPKGKSETPPPESTSEIRLPESASEIPPKKSTVSIGPQEPAPDMAEVKFRERGDPRIGEADDQSATEVEEELHRDVPENKECVLLATEYGEESLTSKLDIEQKGTSEIPPPESTVEIWPQELASEVEEVQLRDSGSQKISSANDRSATIVEELDIYECEESVLLTTESEKESPTKYRDTVPTGASKIPPPESTVEIEPQEAAPEAAEEVESRETASPEIVAEETEIRREGEGEDVPKIPQALDRKKTEESEKRPDDGRGCSADPREDEEISVANVAGGSVATDIVGSTKDEEVVACFESIGYVEAEDVLENTTNVNDQDVAGLEEEPDGDVPESEIKVLVNTETGEESRASRQDAVPKDESKIPPPESKVEIGPQGLATEVTKVQFREGGSSKIATGETEVLP